LYANAISWKKQNTKTNAVHFLNINFHFAFSLFISCRNVCAAPGPRIFSIFSIVSDHQAFASLVPLSRWCNFQRRSQSLASHSRRHASDQVCFSPSSKVAGCDKGCGDLVKVKGLAFLKFVQYLVAMFTRHFGILIF
jgi:hypothetical protein